MISYKDLYPQLDKRELNFLNLRFTDADQSESIFSTLQKTLLRTANISNVIKVLVNCRLNDIENFDEAYIFLESKEIVPIRLYYFTDYLSHRDQNKINIAVDYLLTLQKNRISAMALYDDFDFNFPGGLIEEHVPRVFNKENYAIEKQAFLNEQKTGFTLSVDTEKLLSLTEKIVDFFKQGNYEAKDYNNIYEKFLEQSGFEFPSNLKLFYSKINGITGFTNEYDLLSPSEILEEWMNWKQIFDNWTLEELTFNNQADSDKSLGIYTTPHWVPILHDGCGNFLAMDLLPNSKGNYGQVIRFGADEIKIKVIADSFEKFLEQILSKEV